MRLFLQREGMKGRCLEHPDAAAAAAAAIVVAAAAEAGV